MYSRISIKNFREIGSLEVEGLRRINLIVGRNNSGKTSFLESLFLLGGAPDPHLPTRLGQMRGQRLGDTYPDQLWRPLFHNMDPKSPVELFGQWDQEPRARKLRIDAGLEPTSAVPPEEPAEGDGGIATTIQDSVINRLNLHSEDTGGNQTVNSAIFDPDTGTIRASGQQRSDFGRTTLLSARAYPNPARYAQQFSSLLKKKQDRDVMDGLKIIAPNLQRIEVVSESIGPSIYLDVGLDALVPLTVSGEGMVRMFSIILELISSRNGVLLIDEIDNGLHHKVMPKLWELLGALVEKHNVQIFATTHNDEIVRTALEVFRGLPGVLGLFRIDKRGDRHVMVGYDDEAMEAVLETHFEVRG